MSSQPDVAMRVDQLRASYAGIGGPAAGQWDRLLAVPADRPLSLVNLFAFREVAAYEDPAEAAVTGRAAFDRYAAVSALSSQSM